MKQSITLRRNLRRNTLVSKKRSSSVGRPTYSLSKVLLVWGVVLAFTLPVWRSGLKSNLTLAGFVWNHTIFGEPVEFVPKEDYETALQ